MKEMKTSQFKNNFNGDLVNITGKSRNADGVKYVEYEKTIPVKVGSQVISSFSKPEHAFQKAYSPCKN